MCGRSFAAVRLFPTKRTRTEAPADALPHTTRATTQASGSLISVVDRARQVMRRVRLVERQPEARIDVRRDDPELCRPQLVHALAELRARIDGVRPQLDLPGRPRLDQHAVADRRRELVGVAQNTHRVETGG